MRKSKLHLTLYQLSITYMWTLPVSTQQVMILLSIRQLANKKKKKHQTTTTKKAGRLETACLAGFEDLVFASVSAHSVLIGRLDLVRPCVFLHSCDLIASSDRVEASLKCVWISLEDITYATFLQYLINHKETKTHMAWGNNWKIRWPFGNRVNFWTRGTEKKKY